MCNAAAGVRAPATHARHGVIALLRDDFDRVLEEFRRFNELDAADTRTAARLAQRAFAEWKVVAAVEKKLLYPALRSALQHTDLIEQSEIEHICIDRLVDALEDTEPTRADFRRNVRVLGDHVRLHVQDEEIELFPALSDEQTDWQRLYADMRSCRAELAEDLGIPHMARPVIEPVRASREPAAIEHTELIDETAEA